MNRGVLYAIGAYGFWGLLPIYWKLLQHVPALETLLHRTAWSLVFVGLLLLYKNKWGWLKEVRQNRRTLGLYLLSSILLALNWLIFIWAVNAEFVVDASLGYFINPLLSVVLGVLFLSERLRPYQWTAVAIALSGVLYLTIALGRPPWIALSLATTFGFYGLMRKTAPLPSLQALGFETAVLTPIALLYFVIIEINGSGHFFTNLQTGLLLAMSGAVTAIPLLLFGAGAKRIDLSTIGILQYIAPTMQFLLGVFLYNEPFSQERLIGFVLIWVALLVYAIDGIWNGRVQPNRGKLRPLS